MSKSIKILFLFLIISLFYKSTVIACAPGFPEYIYDPSQILTDYYPLISGIGETDYKKNPILNQNFEVIAPIWGPEYLLPVYLSSINKELPNDIKNAWANIVNDRDYYMRLKRNQLSEDYVSVDSPMSGGEKNELTFWQKISLTIDGFLIKNKSESEMENEYKMAADEYHKGNYNKSIALFNRIYKNKKHSYRDKAALSLGWSYIAKANQQYELDLKNKVKDAEKKQIENLKIAQTYYQKIVADSSLSEVRLEAEKYLDYVLYRTDPVFRMTRAAKVMLATTDPQEFLRNLNDYIPLWYKYFYRHIVYDKEVVEFEKYSKQIKESGDEFSQFLLAWTDLNYNSLDNNIDKYKESNSPLWLIISQRQIETNNKEWNYINDEINKISTNSPFYLTAQYYNFDKQSGDSKLKEVIKDPIKKLISQTDTDKQYSAQNLFNSLMFNLSDDLVEKQKYSLMNNLNSYWTFWDSTSWAPYYQYLNYKNADKNKVYFISYKMKQMLASLDINKFNELLSKKDIFNPQIKQYLRLVLFTKSVLNNQFDISKNMAVLLAKNNSEIAKDLAAFIKTQDQDEQKFLAAKFILDYPEITDFSSQSFDEFSLYEVKTIKEIDNFRRNWAFEDSLAMPGYPDYYEKYEEYKNNKINSDDLLVNKISQIVIDYAIKNSNHSLVPMALSQVVDLVHYGTNTDKKSAEYAKRAFTLLHTNYPNNYWAKQTPYWYEY
ncbi:MAG: hypothetical protein WCT51_04595 [Candidatus Shapirobacteria bacterium]|jgi:hypothetical protein